MKAVISVLKLVGNEVLLQNLVRGLSTPFLIVFIVVSLFILSKGADFLVDGVVSLARRTGIPRIIIGATIVSLGTTTPEAFVSVMAAWMGNPGLALGNGVGSIIADTGLIFGLSCVLVPMPVNRFVLNRTGWVQVGSATLLVIISVASLVTGETGPVLGRGIGLLFLMLLGAYLFVTYVWAKEGAAGIGEEADTSRMIGLTRTWFMILGGLAAVIVGARVLIPCATEIARRIAVPEDVIAATMVALGTSLPELVTAVSAIRKGHPEITVGNIVGADVLNCLFVIGASAVARPLQIPGNFYTFHFPAMLIILYSLRGFIFMNHSGPFRRWQGIWLLGIYVCYVALQYALNIGTGGV
jgi:cation:H+ antiporter